MPSKALTVAEYIGSLPADRQAAIRAVREVILKNLDKGFQEHMQYGMIGYCVPHSIFPAGYHCNPSHPLPFAGLASQKGHMSIYLMSTYGNPAEDTWFRTAWAKTGKKLDMGKCCIRFKKLDDIPLDVLGNAISRVKLRDYVARYEANLAMSKPAKKSASPRKAPKPGTRKPTGTPKAAGLKKATRAKKKAGR